MADLNSRVTEWDASNTDKRRRLLLEIAAKLDLAVVNIGQPPIYRRRAFGYSIPDVTMVMEYIRSLIRQWRMVKEFTSYHHK